MTLIFPTGGIRDFYLLSGRRNDRKATVAAAGRQTVVSHH